MTNSTLSTNCKFKNYLKKLAKIRIKSDYKLDLAFYNDADEKQPCTTYSTSGTSKFNALKLICVISVFLLVLDIISTINNGKNK